MSTAKVKIALISILSLTTYFATAQGCSDAGFCTLNSFKPNSTDSVFKNKNQFKIGASLGSGDNSISVFGNYIEYNRQISNSFGVDAKITSLSQSGNGISNFGISDIYLNGNYNATTQLKFTVGLKIPLTNDNKMKDNIALPMDYQSSLGTFDLITGLGYELKKMQLTLAYQQPLTQNKNEFIAENYPLNSPIRQFQTTNKFKRSGDVLLRASYPIKAGKKIKITPSLLPIYHLANDKFTNALAVEKEIKGSKGLTLNGNIYLDYEINKKSALQLNIGSPFIVRDSRPDGLTRSFIANLEYKIKF